MVLKVLLLEKIKSLEALLESKGENKEKWWKQMLQEGGSVLNLPDNTYCLQMKKKYF